MMYKKIPYTNVQPVIERFELSDEVLEWIEGSLAPSELVKRMKANEANIDLTLFFCHALPVREAIWWASLVLEQRNDIWSEKQKQAIRNAQAWVREPDETKRRVAEQQAEQLGRDNGPGWLAQAVFWNGNGSIADINGPAVMPPPFLYAQAAAGAINLAAAKPEWHSTAQFYLQAFAMAEDIANGGNGHRQAIGA